MTKAPGACVTPLRSVGQMGSFRGPTAVRIVAGFLLAFTVPHGAIMDDDTNSTGAPRPSGSTAGRDLGGGCAGRPGRGGRRGVPGNPHATKVPEFAALADRPDRGLHGTVACFDWGCGPCLHVVAVTGSPNRTVKCLEKSDVNADLVWLADGRLQLTSGDTRQRIYNIRSGTAEDVPASAVNLTTRTWEPAAVNQRSDTVTATSEGGSSTSRSAPPRPGRQTGPTSWSPTPQPACSSSPPTMPPPASWPKNRGTAGRSPETTSSPPAPEVSLPLSRT